ncbi:phenylacetic acid degradation operon negative regulatory protein PaaX [Weizmannia coagulans]|jgi:phenylacetic acid degradation operon negative regulatory protein|uniref:PaaX family transcrtiptional regulator n=2 Tax=Heyndrickxia TaxID=2837504 RepID=A0AAN0T6C4_HEYCO|nr:MULTISPECIES: phenylacetic acid degradation operon negative regulatory protein PaaX [Heyndrickxia]AJO22639.1 PaaX family transcrtiptional regulator [Heyndrickxia coagulans]AKN55838.1 Phenylacetic acid degradation operon negative regulatory protein PaaX [Heyndrickxia coagulans]ATW82916.1 phenylacetic acid degradation operon negative regulatory protein PaaX [Heyndrickxia coagulans]AVD56416.1 phenylacetic acid degradation operon negative regulatory protein PaaX [Heyndrickxia coagulans]KGB28692
MEKTLNTRSMIFTLYGDYIRHYGSEIWIGSLIKLLEAFGHHEQSVRAAISRMSKQGWVESRKEGNNSYYSLTERGVKRMNEAAGRIFKLNPGKWDGKWRFFLYTIPEKKRNIRDELRKELMWSGFGLLLNSVWLTPNDLLDEMKGIIDKYGINEYVKIFTAENVWGKSDKELVQELWDIDYMNDRYEDFMAHYREKYESVKEKMKRGEMTNQDCFVERTMLVHNYRKLLFVDPGLPEELLPEKWKGEEAAALFRDYYRILAKPANDFFEDIFSEGYDTFQKSKHYDVFDHPLITEKA